MDAKTLYEEIRDSYEREDWSPWADLSLKQRQALIFVADEVFAKAARSFAESVEWLLGDDA